MKPPFNDADRANPGAPKPGGTPPQAVKPGTPQAPQARPPEPRPAVLDAKVEPAKIEPTKIEPTKVEPAKGEPLKPSTGLAPSASASQPAKTDPIRTEPPTSTGPKVETGRPAQPANATPGPVKAEAKPLGAPTAGATGSTARPAEPHKPVVTDAAPALKEPAKPEPSKAEAPKADAAKSEPPKPDLGKPGPGSASEPPRAAGPSQAGSRPGGAGTDGPIIDMKARRVADAVKDDTKAAAAGAGGATAVDKANASPNPVGAGSAPPRVAAADTPSRGPGFGSVAAAGLLGGVIGAGLLFAVERAGLLGNAGEDARLNALDQRISGQFTGLDQRMATLSPRDAVAAIDKRVAANEATLKPLPDAVKAAEAAAKQMLERANGAPTAAPAEGQAAGPVPAAAVAAVPADIAARLDSLDQRVSALQEEPGREPQAESRLGVAQGGDGAKPFAVLDERLKALEGKAADLKATAGRPQPADLAPKLASLQDMVEARTKANADAGQALGQRLDALQKTLDERVKAATESVQTATQASREAAEAGRTQAQETTKALDRRLQDQSEKIAVLDKAVALRAEASTVQAALKVVTADRIAGALDTGLAYAEPLATLRKLETGDTSRIDALSPFAEKGAPTAVQLAAAFRPIADRIAAARKAAGARDVAANGDLKSRFLSIADSIVQVRKVDAPTPADVAESDPAAKVQAALDRGTLREASQAYEAMPQDAKALGENFGTTLKARAQAAQAAQALLSDAFKGLPTDAPAAIR